MQNQIIRYLGIYNEKDLIKVEEEGILLAHEQEHKIIVTYDKKHPFRITTISVGLEPITFKDERESKYQVFEVDIAAYPDVNARIVAMDFAAQILNLRKDLYQVFEKDYAKH